MNGLTILTPAAISPTFKALREILAHPETAVAWTIGASKHPRWARTAKWPCGLLRHKMV